MRIKDANYENYLIVQEPQMIPWCQIANTKYLIVQDDSKYQIPDCSGLFCRLIRDSGICCDEETKFS